MATTYPTQLPTETVDHDALAEFEHNARSVLLLGAYAAAILLTIALATAAAAVVASFTTGLGQFVLVAGGWLAVVSASPEIATRATKRLAAVEFGHRTPRTSRPVTAAVAYLLAR